MAAYYNEIDPFAAQWLRELIAQGFIADGVVDERSITEVQPDDLREFTQCHFFAGIGGWSFALRLAGVPDDFSIYTGSCPCQPFSVAGQKQRKKGVKDERHLWPFFGNLISKCAPAIVVGEQVEAAIAHHWLDIVADDLENLGYACGAAVIPAASLGALTCEADSIGPGYSMSWYMDLPKSNWRTPAVTDSVGGIPLQAINDPENFKSMVKNEYLVRRAYGATPNGEPARTGSSARMNPSHSRWLMGYPPEWDVCAVMAMQSSHK